MSIYKIRYRELAVGEYYEEAKDSEEAIQKFNKHALAGEIDFSDMEVIDGQIIGVEQEEDAE